MQLVFEDLCENIEKDAKNFGEKYRKKTNQKLIRYPATKKEKFKKY